MDMQVQAAPKVKLTIVRGDLTKQKTDAIVNAANEGLHHGAGLAQAIV